MKPPRELGLPYDSWRPGQQLAIRTAFHSKTTHTVIQAPTGAGKSLIATGLTRQDSRRSIVLTATKGLEDQYKNTFAHLFDVRGMSNYPCLAATDEFSGWFRHRRRRTTITCEEGPCRSGRSCTLQQDGCLYFDAVRAAMASRSVLTNYAYYLAMRRYSRGLGTAERLILDEAHSLPEELMSAFRIEIPFALEPPDLPFPDDKSLDRLPNIIRDWRAWASAKLQDLAPAEGAEDIRHRRQKQIDALTRLLTIDETWAWDVGGYSITFEPTIPKRLMPLLADRGTTPHLVYLSATVTPAVLTLLDIDPSDITFQVLKSRFPVARRPVYLVDSVRVDHRMTGEHVAYWLSRIDKIIGKRLDRKGLIHTVSYQRQQWLLAHSAHRRHMIAPASAHELAAAVAHFKASKAPAIFVSPSVTTGWDFPGQTAEYQIIAKLPFPDTRSAIARARIRATPGYRDHLTAQTLVQAAGRIVRSDDDQGETFIVDDHFAWANKKLAPLFPIWFRESISRSRSLPLPPPPL